MEEKTTGRIDIEGKISILFIVSAIIIGAISGLGLGGWEAFFLALIFFYITYKLVPRIFDLEQEPLEGGTMQIIKLGFFPYWLMWLVFWVVVYNLTI